MRLIRKIKRKLGIRLSLPEAVAEAVDSINKMSEEEFEDLLAQHTKTESLAEILVGVENVDTLVNYIRSQPDSYLEEGYAEKVQEDAKDNHDS